MNPELLRSLQYGLIGYLCGSVMFAWLVPWLLYRVDVREYGEDHNPGASNAAEACGFPLGLLCAVLDILKGALPVWLAVHGGQLSGWYLVLPVLAPVLGHAWPPLLRFRGGKCITVAFGVWIGLMPELMVAPMWAVLILLLLPFLRDHALLIIASSLLLLPAVWIVYPMLWLRVTACGVCGLVIHKHEYPRLVERLHRA